MRRALFLHGLAGTGSEWDSLQGYVPARAPDLRSTGTRDQYVADVVDLIGERPVVLIGQSLGGHTAFLVASRHPELVERLVVIEADPEQDPEAPNRIRQLLQQHPALYGTDVDADEASRAVAEVAARDWWNEWRQIRCPVLIVHGDRGMVSPTVAEKMAATVPNGRQAEVADAGHDLHLEQPEQVGILVNEFLRES